MKANAEGADRPYSRDTLRLDEVATRLGIGRTTAYELASRGELPVPTIRLGRRIVVSARALDELLAAKVATATDAA